MDYKRILFKEIQKLEKHINESSKELKFVLNSKWFARVRNVVNDFGDSRSFTDDAYALFKIFRHNFLKVESFDKRLVTIAALAKNQNKQRCYRKTRGELSGKKINQIYASIFELNILYGIISSCSNIDLFPKTGVGESNVEAKINMDKRPIYVEAKALGYSKYDPYIPFGGYVGNHPPERMHRQINDALDSKLADAKQLYKLSNNGPTVLFLSLGFNADTTSFPQSVDLYFKKYRSNVSFIIVFPNAICRGEMKSFPNTFSSFPLSQIEQIYFEKVFYNKMLIDEIAYPSVDQTV